VRKTKRVLKGKFASSVFHSCNAKTANDANMRHRSAMCLSVQCYSLWLVFRRSVFHYIKKSLQTAICNVREMYVKASRQHSKAYSKAWNAESADSHVTHNCTHTKRLNRVKNFLFLKEFPENVKGKAIKLQALTDPEGSRRLRLPNFKTIGT
jgi:hypothetical protein